MDTKFDTRLWNLVAGAALLGAGCGGRAVSQDVGDGETIESGAGTDSESGTDSENGTDSESGTETGPAPAPECEIASDCPGDCSPACIDGMCENLEAPGWECDSDYQCSPFGLCDCGVCKNQGSPPPNCNGRALAVPIPLPEAGLVLTFADVDADGQDELVVATETSLLVYEFAGGEPTVSPKAGGELKAMVAGGFDEIEGEDVVMLVGNGLRLYGSNTDGSFAPAIVSPAPITLLAGLIAGNFDGAPPTDILGWGANGAYLQRGADVEMITDIEVLGAAAFEFDAVLPGYAMRRSDTLDVYNVDLQLTGSAPISTAGNVAAFRSANGPGYATGWFEWLWGGVKVADPTTAVSVDEWVIPVNPNHMLAGDLDGDSVDELVFFHYDPYSSGMSIEFDPLGAGDCWDRVSDAEIPLNSAFGDFDGDGDQELAILASDGGLELIDGG